MHIHAMHTLCHVMRLISVPSGAKMYTHTNTFHVSVYIHSSCKGQASKHTRPYIRPCIHVHARVMLPALLLVILWSALFEMRYLQTPNRLPLPNRRKMPHARGGTASLSSYTTLAQNKIFLIEGSRIPHAAASAQIEGRPKSRQQTSTGQVKARAA